MSYDTDVQIKISRIYDLMPATTREGIVGTFISGAAIWVQNYTGLGSGGTLYQELVEDSAALGCVSWAAGGTSAGFSYSLGALSVNKGGGEYVGLADMLSKRIQMNLGASGKSVRYSKVNQ